MHVLVFKLPSFLNIVFIEKYTHYHISTIGCKQHGLLSSFTLILGCHSTIAPKGGTKVLLFFEISQLY